MKFLPKSFAPVAPVIGHYPQKGLVLFPPVTTAYILSRCHFVPQSFYHQFHGLF